MRFKYSNHIDEGGGRLIGPIILPKGGFYYLYMLSTHPYLGSVIEKCRTRQENVYRLVMEETKVEITIGKNTIMNSVTDCPTGLSMLTPLPCEKIKGMSPV